MFILGACSSPKANVPLKDTFWSLQELNGEDPINSDSSPEIQLIFHINDNSLSGNDGCNKLFGKYTKDEDKFKTSQLISTRMFCDGKMKQAQLFLNSLSKSNKIKIKEDKLIFYNGDIELMNFKAIPNF
jgi:heat shock protein HslJ